MNRTSMNEIGGIVASARSRRWRMLVGGELVDAADGATYESVDPSSEQRIAEVPAATVADVHVAVAAARSAALEWRRVAPRERAAIVRRCADILLEHREELAVLDALDSGNPVRAMRIDVDIAADLMRLYADWALELKGETIPATADHLHYTVREPYGVVARIVPYNHPLMFAAGRSAAPLVAGNSVVLKAPDQTPLTALRMGELFADVLPAGTLTVLTGQGAASGDALVRHPDVRRIAFIGSVPTGRAIQLAAAEAGIKVVTLELGGKNPLVAFADAEPEAVARAAVAGLNLNSTAGQSCGSTSRLLVHESIATEVVERIGAIASAVRVGPPLDEATEMGALVSKSQLDKVMSYVERAAGDGATLVTGGGRPFERGFYVEPTVFADVQPAMSVAADEIFGPVLSILTWKDEEEAIRMANATPYGLTAAVWTNDVRRAHRVARELEAGYVWINSVAAHYLGTPFGGVKDSGTGREEGLEELLSFTQTKTVSLPLG